MLATFEAMDSQTAQPAAHITVLATEAVAALNVRPDGVYVDGTFGGGGHTRLLAARLGASGRVLCIDRDPEAQANFAAVAAEFPGRLVFEQGNYAELARMAAAYGFERVDGILLDLGYSSLQMDTAERGFGFQRAGVLDMRYDRARGQSARDFVAVASEAELTRVLFEYGEERDARRIARAIVRAREQSPIEKTSQLAELVERAVGGRRGRPTHPATRTFQALRIAVNDELGEVERGVRAGLDVLAPGGRFVVIAFHSLEDRIVKRAFADAAQGCVCPRDVPICVCGRTPTVKLIGRAVRPSEAEVTRNPRARSAIMRVAERLP
jgi:16S rRNA (cytosine1402-N4)-methyltransferase